MFPGVWSAFRQGEQKIHAECPVNEEKAHMWCVFVCVTHAQVYIYIHVCVYVRQRIWILAFTVKSRYCSTRQDLLAKGLESIIHTSLTRKTGRPSSSPFLRFLAWGFYVFKYMHVHTPTIFTVMPCCFFCASLKVLKAAQKSI